MNAISDTTSATQTQQMTTVPKWYEMCIEEEEKEEERERQEEERKKMNQILDNRKALQRKYDLEEGEILE